MAYDGTDFHGFQRQANYRTVQAEIEDTFKQILGYECVIWGAGRTDTGVHATGQIIAFKADWHQPLVKLERALASRLPSDIAVFDIKHCAEAFNPRHDAISRVYEYTVLQHSVHQPLRRRYVWQMWGNLDVKAMDAAARRLIGSHDFVTFGSATTGEETIRKVIQARWDKREDATLCFTIEANAFLFRMVRRIVATMIRIGRGNLKIEDIDRLLDARNPDLIKGIAPACGLCLVKVRYNGENDGDK